MTSKIYWLVDNRRETLGPSPAEQDVIYSNMLSFAKQVARPSTEFVMDFVDTNLGEHFAHPIPYVRAFLAVEILERLRQAEANGFDAAFSGMCFGEFFLQDARQAVKMPVVGGAESAMVFAQLLGKKFGILTVSVAYENAIQQNIRNHGWEHAAMSNRPVRSWGLQDLSTPMLESYAGRPERLIEEFDKRARALVDDGADVVICGCNPYGAALAQAGYNEVSGTGVPVVTPLAAQIKLAESLIDLRQSLGLAKSEAITSPYRSTPPQILDDLAAHGIGMPEVQARVRSAAESRLQAA